MNGTASSDEASVSALSLFGATFGATFLRGAPRDVTMTKLHFCGTGRGV